MVDLTTFGDNVDSTRFESSMQSTPINGRRNLYVSDKGLPRNILGEVSGAASLTNDGKNIEGSVFDVKDSSTQSQAFIGTWDSASSQVLVNFTLDDGT